MKKTKSKYKQLVKQLENLLDSSDFERDYDDLIKNSEVPQSIKKNLSYLYSLKDKFAKKYCEGLVTLGITTTSR